MPFNFGFGKTIFKDSVGRNINASVYKIPRTETVCSSLYQAINDSSSLNRSYIIGAEGNSDVLNSNGGLSTAKLGSIAGDGATLRIVGNGNYLYTDGYSGFYVADGQTLEIGSVGSLNEDGSVKTSVYGYNATRDGGFIDNSGTVIIKNSVFTDNMAENAYGGVIDNNGSLTVSGSVFKDNMALINGGAIGNHNQSSVATISDSKFIGNAAYDSGGGAISNSEGSVNISNSLLNSNYGGYSGGGAILNLDKGNITISNSQLLNNSADYYGGAVSNMEGSIDIISSTFSSNSSVNTNGGAIYTGENGHLTISGENVISDNHADEGFGGGIYNEYISNVPQVMTTVSGVNFNKNSAGAGGAVFNATNMKISNSSFSDNSSLLGGGAIYNAGSLILDTVNIAAGKEGALNDFYQESGDTLLIGTNTFAGDVIGQGSIDNQGNSTFSGVNTEFLGTYTQNTDGAVTTIASGGTSFGSDLTIGKGSLNWETKNDFSSYLMLYLEDETSLTVGDGINDAVLTINDNAYVSGSYITLKNGGNLKLNDTIELVHDVQNDGILNLNVGGNVNYGITGSGTVATVDDIYNIGGCLDKNIQFKSQDSVVNITGNAGQNFGVITGADADNSGLNLTVDSSESLIEITTNVNVDGTNLESLTFKSGDVNYNANISGTGSITNNVNLTVTGDGSGFNGDYTQNAGSTTFTNGGVFQGDKNINSGTFNVTAKSLDYDKIHLADNTVFSHTASDNTIQNTVNKAVVDFKGKDATASFTDGNYLLAENITSKKSNTVEFNNAEVTLGKTSYTGNVNYTLNNSELNLIGTAGETKNYKFNNLDITNNSKLDLDVKIKAAGSDGSRTITTDTLTINNGGGEFKLGDIYISGEENGYRDTYNTTKDVLTNATFAADSNAEIINGATTTWQYEVGVAEGNNHTISMKITDYTDENTLKVMNNTEGTRFFQFTEGDTRDYHIGSSLGKTEKGTFNVVGNNDYKNIISGAIVDSDGNLTGEKGSLFEIASRANVELNIKNVILQDTEKSGNGSVIYNLSTNANINLDNVEVRNNEGKNVIYNNGVLNVNSTDILSNNVTDGGGIYNKGTSTITGNSTIKNNIASNNGGAILNEFSVEISGDSAIEGNTANNNGGGLFNQGRDSSALINYSSIKK